MELNDQPGWKGSSQHGSNAAVILWFRSWSEGLPSGQLLAGWEHQLGTGGSIRALISCFPGQVTDALWVWASSFVKWGWQTPLPDMRRKARVSHAQWTQGTGRKSQLAGAAETPPQTGRVRTANVSCWQFCRLERLRPRCSLAEGMLKLSGASLLYKRRSSQSQGSTLMTSSPPNPTTLGFNTGTLQGHRHADHSGAPHLTPF